MFDPPAADPWAPPRPGAEQFTPESRRGPALWQPPVPLKMSLGSVPDGRAPVAAVWWVPVVASTVIATTSVAILSHRGGPGLMIVAVAVSLLGYWVVWKAIRPGRLRLRDRFQSTWGEPIQDFSEPPTIPIPVVGSPPARSRRRAALLMLGSAAVGLGMSAAWSLLVSTVVHSKVPRVYSNSSAARAFAVSVVNSVANAILEECGIAVVILAAAGLAGRFLPNFFDARSVARRVAVTAIISGAAVRTLLHIPLWGVGAIGRLGLSLVLAWLFWRTRRIWPLVVAHTVWDILALQVLVSPSLQIKGLCAVALLGWAVTGIVIGIIALRHSRSSALRHSREDAQRQGNRDREDQLRKRG